MPSDHRTIRPILSRNSALAHGAAIALAIFLTACASRSPAPVEDRSTRPPPPQAQAVKPAVPAPPPPEAPGPTYTVKKGDTLYAIALDHGLDYRELAAWNNLENVNMIRTGQVLRLAAPGQPSAAGETSATGVTTTPLKTIPPVDAGDARTAGASTAGQGAPPLHSAPGTRNTDVLKVQPKALKEPYTEQAWRDAQRMLPPPAAPAVAPAPETVAAVAPLPPPPAPRVEAPRDAASAAAGDEDAKLGWIWPANGKLVTGFSDSANLKGIDIAGKEGQPVMASAAGKVVYAGTGLRGYGKLVIIKHNATYLSAYAHNREILVKEGQQVTKGQKIAEMGSTDSDQVKLHFEIRRQGKPVDPLKYLPAS
jgi:lipoprotein NlpD